MSLKRKRFANALHVPSDSMMESEVADESIWSASVTCQPQTTSSSMSNRPPNVKQAKID